MGLGFFFQEMKIRYTGILVKIMRQPYPERKIKDRITLTKSVHGSVLLGKLNKKLRWLKYFPPFMEPCL
jgi:hypothetical protein